MASFSDTIFAPASGAGRSAIAVVRVSGPATRDAVLALAGAIPEPRQASVRALRDAAGELLDRALVLWFPAPASFTGEDSGEFQVHGGRAVTAGVLRALAAVPGCRPAEAGEFTRRALLNDRLGLAEVEGLADLIDAQTEAQRRQALRQFDGALGRWVNGLRKDLLAALALAEGAIDFADEDDLVSSFESEIGLLIGDVGRRITEELARQDRGLRLRDGLSVAISGPPNAGKSTLLNALAGRDVAIVSEHAGTTRDVLTVDLELGGYPVQLIDTAGLRNTDDPVEREGVARARARAASADLVLWLQDARLPVKPDVEASGVVWTVATKVDLASDEHGSHKSASGVGWGLHTSPQNRRGSGAPSDGRARQAAGAGYGVSALTGAGLDELVAGLTLFAAEALVEGEGAMVTQLRHRSALEEAQSRLVPWESGQGPRDFELVAEDLRGAVEALSGLVGRIGTEEVLGAIFARFCIGK